MKTFSVIMLIAFAILKSQGADIITLKAGATYTLGSNDVAEVIATGGNNGSFNLNTTNSVNTIASSGTSSGVVSLFPIVITGPGNTIAPSGTGFVTFRLRTKAEYLSSFSAPSVAISSAVVIPEDAAGPVTIVMESSTDLVTWTSANPGTYGSSTAKRFFRVRAIQN